MLITEEEIEIAAKLLCKVRGKDPYMQAYYPDDTPLMARTIGGPPRPSYPQWKIYKDEAAKMLQQEKVVEIMKAAKAEWGPKMWAYEIRKTLQENKT